MRGNVLGTTAALAVAMAVGLVQAAQTRQTDPAAGVDEAKLEKQENYLGVGLAPVPPPLAAQLPETLSGEQGLVVVHVAPDSPAARVGIQLHDILVRYEDQKIFSTAQLIKLVRGDRPGREVELGVVRRGKLLKVRVKLGTRPASGLPPLRRPPFGMLRLPRDLDNDIDVTPQPKGGRPSVWSSLSSMTLKSLGDGRFRAEVEYKDSQGNTQELTFEGTREEIRKAVEEEKDLPESIRRHLIGSLNFGARPFGFWGPLFRPGAGPGVWFDRDEDFGRVGFPEDFWKDFDEWFERQRPPQIKPEAREKLKELKGRFRSIEDSRSRRREI